MNIVQSLRELVWLESKLLRVERSGQLVIVALILACATALFNGWAWQQRQFAIVSSALQEEAARIAQQKTRLLAMQHGEFRPISAFANPANAYWMGHRHAATYAVLPMGPLALLSIGQADLQAPYIKVSGETKESFVANDEIENPSNLRAGRFDLTFFVVFIAPLLLIAFSYDLLAQDREQQRLCMILSTSVPVGLVLAARASIRLLIVLSPIALATLIGALLGGDGLGLSMVGWLLVVALYLSFWSALACLVNLSRCAPATNAAVLGAVWLLMAVLLPAGLSSAINAATPAPTRAALVNQIRDIQTEVGNRYEAQRQAMPPNGVLNARDFDIAVKRLWVQEQAGRQIDALLRDVQSKADARQTLVEHWGGLSPVLLAHQALLAFSGSSPARYRDFSNQVDRFHREWRDYFAPKVVSNTPLQLLDIDQRPRFAFIDEPQRAVTEAASALVSLGLYFGGALLLMAWQLRRFRLVP